MKALDTNSRYFTGYRMFSFREVGDETFDGMPYSNNALRNCSVRELETTQSLYIDNTDKE